MNEDAIYFLLETIQSTLERTIKRLWILCIILILALILSNCWWIYYENQWQYVQTTEEISQDGTGTNIISGGDTNYGSTSSEVN